MSTSSFNLPAPPGFRGINPDLPIRVYRRHLPHWRQAGATYFVTFRLADSIPQAQLQTLKRWRTLWENSHPEPRSDEDWSHFAREITARTDRYLDQGYGECVFKHSELADAMSESLLKFQDQRHLTSCFVVMPNHVHVSIKPLGSFELEDILEGIKGFIARRINRALGRSGRLWEPESYDRIIRDEEHLTRVVQYIGNNARAAGLPETSWNRWIHPQWEQSGWRFLTQATATDETGPSLSDEPPNPP